MSLDVSLNGVSLGGLDGCITVTDIVELPEICISGAHRCRTGLNITVKCLLREMDPARHMALAARVFQWAQFGGVMTASTRPGQELRVLCGAWPALSALCLMDEMRLTFHADGDFYWADAAPVTLVPGTHTLNCSAATPLDAAILAVTDTTRVVITAGSTAMTFENLPLAAGKTLLLHVENSILQASIDGESVLPCRTLNSDSLLLLPGSEAADIAVAADGEITAAFTGRGRHL